MNRETENVALVYLETPDSSPEEDIAELNELIRSAYGQVVLMFRQSRNFADAKTFIGSGKVTEIKNAIEICDKKIDVVIFSQHLDSLQRKTLQETFDCDVIDYIDLILDIFAIRATTAEGKKQVELAQISYGLAYHSDKNFSRQGGGIGTRGPGETDMETNKRRAREKINRLRAELRQIEKQREINRKQRLENKIFTVALVGYTNAGKSTLFNRITADNVYADDRLFATLDTTVRKCEIDGIEVLFSDTVGFIKNLPTTLIEAFKSTLEEVNYADLLLEVCDITDKNVDEHIRVTEQLLAEIGATAPIVRVYNKCDKFSERNFAPNYSGKTFFVSALTGENVDSVMDCVRDHLFKQYAKIILRIPYPKNNDILPKLQRYALKLTATYEDGFAEYNVVMKKIYVSMFVEYIKL